MPRKWTIHKKPGVIASQWLHPAAFPIPSPRVWFLLHLCWHHTMNCSNFYSSTCFWPLLKGVHALSCSQEKWQKWLREVWKKRDWERNSNPAYFSHLRMWPVVWPTVDVLVCFWKFEMVIKTIKDYKHGGKWLQMLLDNKTRYVPYGSYKNLLRYFPPLVPVSLSV